MTNAPTLMSREHRPAADFAIRHLSVLSYAQGFTHWVYKTSGGVYVPEDYMNSIEDMLQPGDVILISSAYGQAASYVVAPSTGGGGGGQKLVIHLMEGAYHHG